MEIKFSKEDIEEMRRIARSEIRKTIFELQKTVVEQEDKDFKESMRKS